MAISLEKRQQKVGIVLEKRGVLKPPVMRVGFALDVSGSMSTLFRKGVIAETFNCLLAVASRFDDNGELDVWAFDAGKHELPGASTGDYEGDYVARHLLPLVGGMTNYAPVMDAVVDHYYRGETVRTGGFLGLFGKTEHKAAQDTHIPALCLLITDGANADHEQTLRVLDSAAQYPIYWQCIGVGNPREFGFLQDAAERMPNVGFINMNSLSVEDDVLFEALLSPELCEWVKRK